MFNYVSKNTSWRKSVFWNFNCWKKKEKVTCRTSSDHEQSDSVSARYERHGNATEDVSPNDFFPNVIPNSNELSDSYQQDPSDPVNIPIALQHIIPLFITIISSFAEPPLSLANNYAETYKVASITYLTNFVSSMTRTQNRNMSNIIFIIAQKTKNNVNS